MGKSFLVIVSILALAGCEQLGIAFNQNNLAHLRFQNGECSLEIWQSAIDAAQDTVEHFAISETIKIDSECALDLSYSENDVIED